MKNLKYILVLFALTAFMGCEEQLEFKPQQSLDTDLAFANGQAADGALVGVYSGMQDLEVMGSMPQLISEYMADNVNFIGSFPTLQEINQYNTLSNNTSIDQLYEDNFEVITDANFVIANTATVDDPLFSDEQKTQNIAEARFLRAFVYFNMVNLFAPPFNSPGGPNAAALPLVTEPFDGEIIEYSRSTVSEIHAQIIADLDFAIANLPGINSNRGLASSGAAKALKSRLHLYRGEYAEAAQLAGEVINQGDYAAAGDLSFYPSVANPEVVFGIINTAIDNGRTGSGGWDSYFSPAEAGGRGDAPFSADLLATYDANDLRVTSLTEVSPAGRIYTTKYNDAVNNTSDYLAIRVSEMHLTRAEALVATNGLGSAAEAIALVNPIRTRAGLAAWAAGDFADAASLLAAIRNERRLELAFEGHRRMDLLRIGAALRQGFAPAAFGADKTILPIPQREIDINPNLAPNNPGY
ncbi:RagB/SusD family nutrient uptake outer membrane protein [Marivirga arenosa]|uniref:RagB/SusD family nutrient uptake outer membrane protein n=1 Tax=Marivirga arenosa TaxID=3059076 RepID=A0AA51ZX28_9BACT|nr:RagB/SusD family nutrient uptake outer membrane protein [Marivirga sp. BKB1-2]WNB18281.1 RagB/SusD family nutrient uptake outer membrane protein [Marivirga sp. BKB1-2]